MEKLIKAEFYKLQKFPSFRKVILFTLAVGILRGFSSCTGYQVYTSGLSPELFDAALISVFTAAFLCTEFSNRTFGNTFFCGTSRQSVFFAKLVAYFSGLFILVLIPLAVSTVVATMGNGFGADWDAVVLKMAGKLLSYLLYRFFMASVAILVAVVVQNPVGTLGVSAAGLYLMAVTCNPAGNLSVGDAFIMKIAIFLFAAVAIFARRDFR